MTRTVLTIACEHMVQPHDRLGVLKAGSSTTVCDDSQAWSRLTTMFYRSVLSIISTACLLAAVPYARAQQLQCSGAQPLNMCCQFLNPFSDNEYVWENVCGVHVPDTSVPVGSDCSMNVPNWYAILLLITKVVKRINVSLFTVNLLYILASTSCAASRL